MNSPASEQRHHSDSKREPGDEPCLGGVSSSLMPLFGQPWAEARVVADPPLASARLPEQCRGRGIPLVCAFIEGDE